MDYHWGFINKIAGTGYVTYSASGNRFYGQLEGHSIPWGGRIYTVHTSLSANFSPDRGNAPSTETVTGMQGIYSKPLVGTNPENAKTRNIYGQGQLSASPQTMEAVTIMTDMLSIFYYAKELDFPSMRAGTSMEIPIIRGGGRETLYLTYNGTSEYSNDGYSTPAYSISFQYTYNGAPDKYRVQCLISQSRRIPVFFSADLLIGHMEMQYVP